MRETSQNNDLSALKLVQETELGLMDFLDGVCRSYGIRYSLIFGSLIGAVRHKGFIPWDDDIDVVMPREDYDRFLSVVVDDAPEWIEVQHFRLGSSKRYVARIADKRTLMHLDSYSESNDLHIWLDIFPIDGLPDFAWLRRCHLLYVLWRKACCSFAAFDETVNLHRPGRPQWQQAIIWFFSITHMGRLWNLDRALDLYDSALRKYSPLSGGECFCGVGTYGFKRQIWPSFAFNHLVEYEFEGRHYFGPEDADAILAVTYSDYMQLPPEGERTVHQIDLVEHPNMHHARANEQECA